MSSSRYRSSSSQSFFLQIKNYFFIIATLAIILLSNIQNIKDLSDGRYYIYEQDAYMHLVIATDFLENQTWYQHSNPRVNAPWGVNSQGWTNLVTAILAVGAFLLSFFMPLSSALYYWGFWLPLLFYAFASWSILWATKGLKPTTYQQLFVLAAFLLNPFISSFFIPLRVDYDFLLIPLAILYWGCLLRLIQKHKPIFAVTAAWIAALGVWASISFILLIMISLVFIFYRNVVKKELKASSIILFLATICLAFAVIIALEHRHFFTITHDIISIVHLLFFCLLTACFVIYAIFLRSSTLSITLIFIICVALIIFQLMNWLFPGFYLGPYNHVDPYLLQHFFPKLSEFYSPFRIDPSLALATICYFIIGGGYCYYLSLSNELCTTKQFLLWLGLITTLLTAYMYRWVEFSIPLNIVLVSLLMRILQNKTEYLKVLFLLVMVFLPSLILSLSRNYFVDTQQLCQQQLYLMLRNNFLNQAQFSQDKTLFIHSNYGPLLLYYTRYAIVATNDHHNPHGLKDSLQFFNSSEANAKTAILGRKVDLVLLCPKEHATQFNPNVSSWLQPITLPKEYSQWKLYRPKP